MAGGTWLHTSLSASTVTMTRGRQRGCTHETTGDGARSGGGRDRREIGFGPWEQIFYGEFDGRRRKRALVKIIGE